MVGQFLPTDRPTCSALFGVVFQNPGSPPRSPHTLVFKAERRDPPSPGSLKMASDPGFFDVLGGEEAIGELPYPQEYDYLWTDERNEREEGNGILDPRLWLQGAADRQGVAGTNPLAVAFVVGIAYSGLLLANSLLNPPPKPGKLENDDMCGITTGGQAECWWDCKIISARQVNGKAFTNPECLRDCFSGTSGTKRRQRGKRRKQRGKSEAEDDSSCFAALIEDVLSKGTCNTGANPAATFNIWGFDKLVSDCEMTEPAPAGGGGSGLEIVKGTCSQDTEDRLSTPSCINFLAEQPTIVKNTLQLLIQFSCSAELYKSLVPGENRKVKNLKFQEKNPPKIS